MKAPIINIFLVLTGLALSPLMFVISKALDYFEGKCFLASHAWYVNDKVYMLPMRQCTKCGQIQVKLPKMGAVSCGGWVDHDEKKDRP